MAINPVNRNSAGPRFGYHTSIMLTCRVLPENNHDRELNHRRVEIQLPKNIPAGGRRSDKVIFSYSGDQLNNYFQLSASGKLPTIWPKGIPLNWKNLAEHLQKEYKDPGA